MLLISLLGGLGVWLGELAGGECGGLTGGLPAALLLGVRLRKAEAAPGEPKEEEMDVLREVLWWETGIL